VIDLQTGKRIEPDIGCLAAEMEWAPNGRAIAVGGRLYRRPVSVLCWVRIPEGDSRMLDTLPVFSRYRDFAWSPNSRSLVVTRVTAIDSEEMPTASDLWIFERDGLRCPLTETAGVMETRPRWVDSSRILYLAEGNPGSSGQSARLRALAVARNRSQK
jgi:hypothetical protein